jgi:hypothetical protein
MEFVCLFVDVLIRQKTTKNPIHAGRGDDLTSGIFEKCKYVLRTAKLL